MEKCDYVYLQLLWLDLEANSGLAIDFLKLWQDKTQVAYFSWNTIVFHIGIV